MKFKQNRFKKSKEKIYKVCMIIFISFIFLILNYFLKIFNFEKFIYLIILINFIFMFLIFAFNEEDEKKLEELEDISRFSYMCDKHENFLFSFKFFICIPVLVSLILSIILFFIGFIYAIKNIILFFKYSSGSLNSESVNFFYIKVLSIADIFYLEL